MSFLRRHEEDGRRSRGIDGIDGERGKTGDDGARGLAGPQGERGRGLSVIQAFAMFFLVLLIGLVMTWRVEQQQRQIVAQQAEIQANAAMIAETQHKSCINGLQILRSFNAQQDALADIERTQTIDLRLQKARIKAYESGKIEPLPTCGG